MEEKFGDPAVKYRERKTQNQNIIERVVDELLQGSAEADGGSQPLVRLCVYLQFLLSIFNGCIKDDKNKKNIFFDLIQICHLYTGFDLIVNKYIYIYIIF